MEFGLYCDFRIKARVRGLCMAMAKNIGNDAGRTGNTTLKHHVVEANVSNNVRDNIAALFN